VECDFQHYFFTFALCRYITHSKWAAGDIETENASLPYPKKVKLSAADARLALPVQPCSGVFESVSTTDYPTSAFAVSHELPVTDEVDAWAASDMEQSETFWRENTSNRTSCSSVGQLTPHNGVRNDSNTLSEWNTNKNVSWSCTSAARASHNVDEWMCKDRVDNVTVDTVSVLTQNSSSGDYDDFSTSDVDAVTAASCYTVKDAQKHSEFLNTNTDKISNDAAVIITADSVSEANVLLTTRDISCLSTNSDVSCHTSSHCQPHVVSGIVSAGDNIDVTGKTNDSDTDICVLDDTEDSDVDDSFVASRSPWQTVIEKDPYPVKECLLLSFEEVGSYLTLEALVL